MSSEILASTAAASAATTRCIKTTCPYCGVGCGILAEVDSQQRQLKISGDPEHPANFGRLCSKGSALGETIGLEERAAHPLLAGQRVSWDTALEHVAQQLGRVIAEHGKDAVMLYVSGQLLTEDYYVANKFIKGFIGSNNIDSNSRLCMSSAVAAYKRAFGSDTVPNSYSDIEASELVVITGSNMAWCHPVLFQRLKTAKENNPDKKVVVIDPRRTDTCALADWHLAIKPGTDTALFNGLLNYLQEDSLQAHGLQQQGAPPPDASQLAGLPEALAAAQHWDIERVAATCEIEPATVSAFYAAFARSHKVLTLFSMGVNQSSSGTDKANAIINCHLYSRKLGYPGAGPFSLTGQPNAMGGREVGALSNLLAAHYDLNDAAHREEVGAFWQAPRVLSATPGITAPEAASAILDGRIKAIWIMATNPVVSLPDAARMREALQQCELVIVSDCVQDTATARYADVLLPALGWSEKSGTVTNSERCISRQRPLFPAYAEARPDWWMIAQVARRMGFSGFDYTAEWQIFREHAALSAHHNHGQRYFNIAAWQQIDAQGYAELKPQQWPLPAAAASSATQPVTHFFAELQGALTADGRCRMVPIEPRPPRSQCSSAYPLVMNTGRIRDQWHTMTRTALAPRLNQHFSEPFVQIHPKDAVQYQLQEGGLARVSSALGSIVLRVHPSEAQRRGEIFVPMHWSEVFASCAGAGALIANHVCPVSGQPESKFTPVNIAPLLVAQSGYVLSRHALQPDHPQLVYWARRRDAHGNRYQLALDRALSATDWQSLLLQWLNIDSAAEVDYLIYSDPAQAVVRCAVIAGEQLLAAGFFAATADALPADHWLTQCFAQPLDAAARRALLAGAPLNGDFDVGRIVCACFSVGEKTICNAVREQGLGSAEAVGAHLQAGTNCGSCVAEIKALIAATRADAPPES